MKRYIKKNGRRVYKIKARPARRYRKNKRLSFAKRVQKVISKNIETKVAVYTSNVTAFNQQVNSAGDCLRLMPEIPLGTGQSARIGSEIKLQSLRIRGVMTFAFQTDANNSRIGVRLMVLRAKKFNDWNQTATDMNATGGQKLLEGSTAGLQGTLAQFNTPPNLDYYSVVADKRFYMSQSVSTSATNVADTYNTTKFINFEVPYSRRTLKFDEGNLLFNDPLDFPYTMVLSYCKLSGTGADLAATTYLTFQYTATAKYEDA